MSLFSKLFVEEAPNYRDIDEHSSVTEEGDSVEVELDGVNRDTLIDDIYAQNDLYDKAKSIFKVEELINSLPKEMVTDTKKASVLATLGVFGLTVTDVSIDGESRTNVLSGVLTKIVSEGNEALYRKETEIEELKKEIAGLEKEISETQNEMKMSENTISTEVSRINELIKFVGGTE